MEDLRSIAILELLQGFDHSADIVPVDRTAVVDAQLVKDNSGSIETFLSLTFHRLDQFPDARTQMNIVELNLDLMELLLEVFVEEAFLDALHILREAAQVLADR